MPPILRKRLLLPTSRRTAKVVEKNPQALWAEPLKVEHLPCPHFIPKCRPTFPQHQTTRHRRELFSVHKSTGPITSPKLDQKNIDSLTVLMSDNMR
jgi:hypothetical protein